MEKPKIIQITKEDICNGERGDFNKCAVALALQRGFSSADKVDVDQNSAKLYGSKKDDGYLARIEFDGEIFEWIEEFDAEVDVQPFMIELRWIGDSYHANGYFKTK